MALLFSLFVTFFMTVWQERQKFGIDRGMVRISVGVEDLKDIIYDLKQALEKLPAP